MRNEASSSISIASAPSSTNTGKAATEASTESNKARPVDFNGGSSIVLSTTWEKNAKVPSDPIIKCAKISNGFS